MIQLLAISPMYFLVAIFAILVTLSVHEFSHALGAHLMGDKTAQYAGRLTLNPLAHIDWLGFLLLLMVGFGWGKPVPFNVYNLRNNRWGQAVVAGFGPLSNFLLVALSFLLLYFLPNLFSLSPENLLVQFLFRLAQISFILGVFNLIPIPPLDGSKVFFSFLPKSAEPLINLLESRGPWILLLLILLDSFTGIQVFSRFLNWAWNFVIGFIP